MRARRAAALLGLLAALPCAPLAAQPAATSHVVASVTVATPPPFFLLERDLAFGTVQPGQTVDVPAVEPFAPGTWSAAVRFFNIRKQSVYALHFTLPTALQRGAASIPVSFSGTQFGHVCVPTLLCYGLNTAISPASHASAATAFNIDLPNSTPGNNFPGDVFIGGRLTVPATALPPGTYTATLTATLTVLN